MKECDHPIHQAPVARRRVRGGHGGLRASLDTARAMPPLQLRPEHRTAGSNSEHVHFSREGREGTTVMGVSEDTRPHKRKGR